MPEQRQIAPNRTAAHPHQSSQSQSRAEKFLVRAARHVSQQKWSPARYSYDRALNSDPDPATEAFATIGYAACEAAIAALDNETLDPVAEYARIEGEMQYLVPRGGGA